jgi:hypothetical protein
MRQPLGATDGSQYGLGFDQDGLVDDQGIYQSEGNFFVSTVAY